MFSKKNHVYVKPSYDIIEEEEKELKKKARDERMEKKNKNKAVSSEINDDFIKTHKVKETIIQETDWENEKLKKEKEEKKWTIDDLEKLANLKEKGFITDEEFQEKKRQILGL
jgi:hypothetical protein